MSMTSAFKAGWLQFRIQSILLVLVIVAVALAWWRDRSELAAEVRHNQSLLAALRQDREQQERMHAYYPVGSGPTSSFGANWAPRPGPNLCETPAEFVAALRGCAGEGQELAYENLANSFARTPIADQAVPNLVELLAEDDRELRERAAMTLGKMAVAWKSDWYKTDERAETLIPALISLLDHDDMGVRYQACSGLQMFGSAAAAAVPILQECMSDDESSTAPCAAMTLRAIDPASDVETRLIELIKNKDMLTRQFVASGLAEIGSAKAKAALVAAYEVEADASVKQSLAGHIARLDAKGTPEK